VVTATPDETIADAARRMRDHHVGTVVVVDGEKRDRPTGILTDRDIVVSAVAQSPDKVGSLLVGDVMTRDVITTRPATTLRSALSTMHSRGIRRLPVVSGDGRLEGLIAFDDILEVTSWLPGVFLPKVPARVANRPRGATARTRPYGIPGTAEGGELVGVNRAPTHSLG